MENVVPYSDGYLIMYDNLTPVSPALVSIMFYINF